MIMIILLSGPVVNNSWKFMRSFIIINSSKVIKLLPTLTRLVRLSAKVRNKLTFKGVQPDGGWPSTVNLNICVIIQ